MAVYTEVNDQDLARFVAGYGLGTLKSYKGIAEGVENTNYFVDTSAGPFILTLYEKRVAREDLPFFLGLMEHLSARGLSCPLPVRDSQQRVLGELAGRPAALVTFLDGVWPRKPERRHAAAVGRELARMHDLGRDFPIQRRNALGLADWRPLFEGFAAHADDIAPNLAHTIDDELRVLEREWPKSLPTGVIHGDLFPDNVFFLGDRLSGLIDFYFACNDALAYDIAVCLNAWCFEPDNAFNLTKGRALLTGYAGVRSLTAAEYDAIPMLARGAALRFLLTRAYDWINTPKDALVKRKDPMEYLRRLRFHQSVRSTGEYGLEPSPKAIA